MPGNIKFESDPEKDAEAVPKRAQHVFETPIQTGVRATLLMAATSLGIIYGDIGTSPLYVLNAIFPGSGPVPSPEDSLGAISAIIWAITIIPLIKYCIVALEFGNGSGEGGPFAVYTALYPPKEQSDENRALTTYTTSSLSALPRGSSFFNKKSVKRVLFLWVLFGTCLTISDGLLTPAVSVTSAVEGISVAFPSVAKDVVGISVAILVVLFLAQAFGTRKVGFTFAPVVFLWLAVLGISGIINIVDHPAVFRAFDPSRAVMLFVRTKNFDLLSGVLLAITGVEAMFANLGQFSKNSIRVSFGLYAYPCLILAYLGQGSQLITRGDVVISNVFFQSIPGKVSGPFWWITWILSILATVVASQAMITATFSLVQQLTRLHAMPSVKIIHTADDKEGQLFVPSVNILLMIGTIGVTVGFGTSANLTHAYGFAVSGVLIVTTTILAIAIVRLKHLPLVVGLGFFIVFGFFDGLFWGSSLKKVPTGAWFPLGMAIILCACLQYWSWAKHLENSFDADHRHHLNQVIRRPGAGTDLKDDSKASDSSVDDEDVSMPTLARRTSFNHNLQLIDGGVNLIRLPTLAFFHNSSAHTLNGAPHSFSSFLKSYPGLPQVVVFFNVRVVGIAHTSEEERFVVSRVRSFDGIYIATLRLGYRDPIDLSEIAKPVRDRIIALERNTAGDEVAERVALIDNAIAGAVTHILPNFHVYAAQKYKNKLLQFIHTFLIESIYRRVKVNFDEFDAFQFNPDQNVLRMGVAAAL